MKKTDEVGARIAYYRNMRGLSQFQLAALANVGRDYLAHVERGKKSPTSVWVGRVAASLGVDSSKIYGTDNEVDQIDRIAPTVRLVLASLEFPPDIDAEPLDVLRPQVEQVERWRHNAAYDKIVLALPDLVDQLLVAGQRDGAPAYALLTSALRAANTLGHKTGHYDLSLLATNYMVDAAKQTEDPLLTATTQYVRSAALARVGATDQAVLLTDRTITEIEPLAEDETGAAVLCALHMRRAGLASTAFDADTTDAHFAEARRLAERVGDRQVMGTVVGPTNIALWELSSANDLGRTPKALEIAEATSLPGDYPRERIAHYWLDKARAHLSAGQSDEAIDCLQAARVVAPEYFRKSRAVKTAIKTTAAQQKRAGGGLPALANYAGIEF
ncbi:helix-turn-helix domain-containing protein [Nocardia brasiliensis]|uniref:helix-turn-helix domain-containing protein n=1 Tax=Nocardia brasiliensis TaxID=37326 RepID=UPI0024571589|nr:helix-turn-helix transcriptional regulator [Nocardia brasiliensis]